MNAGGDFRYVAPTQEERDAWRAKYNRSESMYRGECIRCGKRIWLSGIGIGSHRRACKGTA
jgi:hypothetical protein